jgi:hypothetical protein
MSEVTPVETGFGQAAMQSGQGFIVGMLNGAVNSLALFQWSSGQD